jgi:hypothetical protein
MEIYKIDHRGFFPRVSVLLVLYTNKEESFVTWQDQTFSPIVLKRIQSQRRVWSFQSFTQPTREDCGSFPSSHDMVYLNPPALGTFHTETHSTIGQIVEISTVFCWISRLWQRPGSWHINEVKVIILSIFVVFVQCMCSLLAWIDYILV